MVKVLVSKESLNQSYCKEYGWFKWNINFFENQWSWKSHHSNIIFIIFFFLTFLIFFLIDGLNVILCLDFALKNVKSKETVDRFEKILSFLAHFLTFFFIKLTCAFFFFIDHEFNLAISAIKGKAFKIEWQWKVHHFFTAVVGPIAKFLFTYFFKMT